LQVVPAVADHTPEILEHHCTLHPTIGCDSWAMRYDWSHIVSEGAQTDPHWTSTMKSFVAPHVPSSTDVRSRAATSTTRTIPRPISDTVAVCGVVVGFPIASHVAPSLHRYASGNQTTTAAFGPPQVPAGTIKKSWTVRSRR
jgi:hypothetical protein